MDFFDSFPPPPPPPRPARQRRRSWYQPDHVLPASVPGEALLIRTDDAAVWVGAIRVYPNGFEFALRSVRRELPDGSPRMGRPFPHHHPDPFRAEDRDTGLRLGVEYADGRRAATGDGLPYALARESQDADALRILEHGGSGSDLRWDAQFWVSPLPPDGPVTLVGAWPDAGVGERRAELDGTAIRSAVDRTVVLWPEDEYLDDEWGTTRGVLIVESPDPPEPAEG